MGAKARCGGDLPSEVVGFYYGWLDCHGGARLSTGGVKLDI